MRWTVCTARSKSRKSIEKRYKSGKINGNNKIRGSFMEFKKISAPSLRDLFIEQIEHMILSGQLKIGENT